MIDDIINKVKQETQNVLEATSAPQVPGGKPVDKSKLPTDDHAALKKELKDFALGKVIDRVDEFSANLDVFEMAGFKLKRLDVELGLSPGVDAHFQIVREPTEQEQREALQRLSDNRTLQGILNTMLKAIRLHHVLHIGDLELVGIVVSISTMPSVQLVFAEEEPPQDQKSPE